MPSCPALPHHPVARVRPGARSKLQPGQSGQSGQSGRRLWSDEAGGFEATKALMAVVLDVTNEIGLAYKNRFSRPRPNIIQPLLRPFIAGQANPSMRIAVAMTKASTLAWAARKPTPTAGAGVGASID
jgi:hypothetical protein